MNYELDRHVRAALRRGNQKAAEAFRDQRKVFNTLKDSGVVFELPKETHEYVDIESIEPQETDLQILGKVLQQRRLELGLFQKDLKQRLGLSRVYIAMVEGGKRRPSKKVLEGLSANLQFNQSSREKLFRLAGHPLASQGETLQA